MVESVGKYQRYAEYKDSGVEWLGEVPEHWTISKFNYVKKVLTDFTANGSFADLKSNVAYLDEPSFARLVRLTDLRKDLLNQDGVWISKKSYSYLKKSTLFGGEFLLANVGAYAGLFYQMPYNKGFASLAPNMLMAKFLECKVTSGFMAYVGQSDNISSQLKLSATSSSAQPKLNKDDFKKVYFCYPSINEQNFINDFLDHETAKIDSLIEKQKQLIQLLKEKRQAVISHAVTKGLDPSVKMKDSGVEWLGEVPEHWEVGRLKNVLSIKNGRDYKAVEVEDGGYPVYGSGGIFKRSSEFLYDGISLLFGRKGTIDKPLLVKGKFWTVDTMFYSELVKNVDPEYIYFQSLGFPFDKLSTNTALPSMTQEDLLNLGFVIPPVKEQTEISKFIKQYLEKNHSLMKKAESAIQLMQERRTALISAAVTGKIDVRHWKNAQEVLAV